MSTLLSAMPTQVIRKRGKKQKGFTLIELIVVLLILAVFALIAVPAYLTTVDDARIQAANQAVSEGMYRLSSYTAQQLLQTGNLPGRTAITTYATGNLTAAGDYTLAFADGTLADDIDITATGPNGEVANDTWTRPTIIP